MLLRESFKLFITLISFCLIVFSVQGNNLKYKHYVNVRFEFSVNYPSELLFPQGESDNGDGQRFISKDEKVEMTVSGIHSLKKPLRVLYKEAISERENAVITYKILKKDFFVISGKSNGKIFYQKTMEKDEVFKTFAIEYDESLKETFNPITATISNSFKNTIHED